MCAWKVPDSVKAEQSELLEARHDPWEEPDAPPCTFESSKPYVVKQKKKTAAQIERETNGGRELPRPVCPYDDLIIDPAITAMDGRYAPPTERYISQLKRDPRSCMTCTLYKRGNDCADQCSVPGFFEASTMTPAELKEHDARRAERQKEWLSTLRTPRAAQRTDQEPK